MWNKTTRLQVCPAAMKTSSMHVCSSHYATKLTESLNVFVLGLHESVSCSANPWSVEIRDGASAERCVLRSRAAAMIRETGPGLERVSALAQTCCSRLIIIRGRRNAASNANIARLPSAFLCLNSLMRFLTNDSPAPQTDIQILPRMFQHRCLPFGCASSSRWVNFFLFLSITFQTWKSRHGKPRLIHNMVKVIVREVIVWCKQYNVCLVLDAWC